MRDARSTPPAAPGDLVEVTPAELVAGGDALAKIDGFPIFVRGLFPGDRATVVITEVKKGFARATLVALLEPGPLRRAAPCPVAGDCGGCDWTALRLDHQLAARVRILRESLRRVGKLEPATLPPIALHPSPLNYRVRSRLQYDAARDLLGFFALRSNRVVPIAAECEVVGPATLRNLAALQQVGRDAGADAIETFETDTTLTTNALVSHGPPENAPPVSLRVGKHTYALSTASFFQVNRHLLPRLIELVRGHAESVPSRGVAYDLYAGVGFFTLPLADLYETVFSVEGAPESHRWARRNARGYRNVRAVGRSVEDFGRRGMRADFVMADPPRAGIDPAVVDAIAESGARKICYLSCDPVTFARDVARLARRGWALHTLDLLDLFPNTHHVETLASLVREA
jgi:23S rRNA (uracil1939-C5)-methyltransferase